jgi:hypothetical protein
MLAIPNEDEPMTRLQRNYRDAIICWTLFAGIMLMAFCK